MKRMKQMAIAIGVAAMLIGCGEEKPQAPTQAPPVELTINDAAGMQLEEPEAPTEAPEEPTPEAEPVLVFRDAFGEEYETTILTDVPQRTYDNECFVHEGDRLTYEDAAYASRIGIDISKYQGEIDWEKVKADGITFVFIRIGCRGYGTAGNLMEDPMFADNLRGAQEQGIDVGVYFFAQAINEAEAREEAEFVIGLLNGAELQLPVVYDPETIKNDTARTDDVSGEQFTANTIAFCETIAETGYQPMVYSNMVWEAFQFDLRKLTQYPIWYADYEMLPQTPYWFTFWQYSEEGHVDGITGTVDMNIQLLSK